MVIDRADISGFDKSSIIEHLLDRTIKMTKNQTVSGYLDVAGKVEAMARRAVRWGLYPLSWAVVLSGFHLIATTELDPRQIWATISALLFALYFFIEFALPLQRRWRMTWSSFLADLRFVIVNGAAGAAVSLGLGLLAISTSGEHLGPASNWPPLFQLAAALLIFEAINYTLHRAMHELPGPLGRFLWRSHAAHHLPPRLYLIMHAVFHPINGVIIQALALILPIWLMGYGKPAVAMFFMVNGMHGLISHFNADVLMGWANYLFVGPELHRYHHSADPAEGKNYGQVLSIFDQLFGTFVYRPGVFPDELGVRASEGFPPYAKTLAVLALPFKTAAR